MRKVYIIGNWKMNQDQASIKSFFSELTNDYDDSKVVAGICPQAIHLPLIQNLSKKHGKIQTGAQNCSFEKSGAFTGEISPLSIKDFGIDYTLIGHSERRAIFKENDEVLNKKTLLALESNLKVIFCIGETLEERDAGLLKEVLSRQLNQGLKNIPQGSKENIIVAYEPVWAIGTGKVAGPEEAQEAHKLVRTLLKEKNLLDSESTSILYGGSVKPNNIEGLLKMKDIDGALVGGASIKASDFNQLVLSV